MAQRRQPSETSPDEVQRLRTAERELERVVHDLKVHQEELNIQQAHLVASQQALEATRDNYQELFDFAPVGYLVLDSGGMIRAANQCAAKLFGVETVRLIDQPLFLHMAGPYRRTVLDHIARCRRGEPRVESEAVLCAMDGSLVPIHLNSWSRWRGDQHLFLTAVIDLTESKRMEEERAQVREEQQRIAHQAQLAQAANEAKDRFIAMLSHELRTPLTPILLAVETIRRRETLSDTLQKALEMIHRNVALEARLIDDLLDVSRIIQGKLSLTCTTVDVHELVPEVMEMLSAELRQSGIQVAVDLSAAAHHVDADPVRLRQVLWNLVHNALRATQAGGQITVATGNVTAQWILLTVHDTGDGIDPQVLPRIFNLFEQDERRRRSNMGLGLGLPISKSIMEAHGGHITATSPGRGRGTRVTVDLPTVPAPIERDAKPPAAEPVAPTSRRVLLVEDNEDSASALAEILRMHGYVVAVAGSVKEALRFVEDVDIVISDIGLPDGSGYELMREICARRPLPGIALSGYGTTDDIRESTAAGFERHLIKPVEPQQLLEVLQSLSSN